MKLIGVIFALLGVVQLLVGGIIFYFDFSFKQSAQKTQGTVVEIVSHSGSKSGTQYYPVIEFRNETGQRYTFESDWGSSGPEHRIGDPVMVIYDPKDPSDAKLDGWNELILIGSIFGGIGLVFGSIGGIMVIFYIRRLKEIAWLKQNGTMIEADLDHVHYDTSLKVNGKSPYVIVCQWPNPHDGQIQTIKSERIWTDPAPYITMKKLSVLIDMNNVKRNYVDISFLPSDIKREF